MFDPCVEHCYPRYGKQYSSECDGKCEYARTVKELADVKAERDELMRWAKGRCDTCAHKDDCVKHDPDPEGYVMHWYDDCEIWEWRGVQQEGTK